MSGSSRALALTPRATNELREAAAWYGLSKDRAVISFLKPMNDRPDIDSLIDRLGHSLTEQHPSAPRD